MAAEALHLEGVNAYYGDSHVLHDVSFAMRAGRVLALLGRNGAGKTTCLLTVMGLVRPRSGRIALFGRALAGLAPEAIAVAGVGYVPQGRRVFPTLTVRENLLVARRLRSDAAKPWTLARVFELFPRLEERASQPAGSLSGGEQQMLAIGRALMGSPRVLLMDEPSEGLAPLIVAEVGRTIARLKAEDQCIVLVEQNLKLALDLADDCVVLNTGRVVYTGTREALRADERAVTQYLGVF